MAFVVGALTLLIGVVSALKPQAMSKNFGIAAQGGALPYVMATGVRDVFIGLTVLVLFFREQWNILGYVHFFIGLVAVADFLIVRKYGDKKFAWVHFVSAIAVCVYGAWLIMGVTSH